MAAGRGHAVRTDPFGFARFLPIAAQQKEMEIVRPAPARHDLSQHHRERLRYFLRFPLVSRSVPLLFILIATLVLLIKERIIVDWIRGKALRGELREPVLLAGIPEDIAALERSFTPEQHLL